MKFYGLFFVIASKKFYACSAIENVGHTPKHQRELSDREQKNPCLCFHSLAYDNDLIIAK